MNKNGRIGAPDGHQEITGAEFRDVMGRWPTGVAVVTTVAQGAPTGCTVNAMATVSLTPPLLVVSLGIGSRTLAAIRGQGRFGVNILSAARSELGHRFARVSRDQRFAGVDHSWVTGVPLLDDVLVRGVCLLERQVPVADHVLVVGQMIMMEAVDEVVPDDASPSIRFRHAYWRLSELGAAVNMASVDIAATG